MGYSSSEDEIREIEVNLPSPVKKRSKLLQSSKKRNELERIQKEVNTKLEQIDYELCSYISQKMKLGSPAIATSPSNSILRGFQIDKTLSNSDNINFEPTGRTFFIEQCNDRLSPSSWFPKVSIFHNSTTDEFISYLKMGFLHPRSKSDTKEAKVLRLYCLQLLTFQQDPLTTSILLQFLSFHLISYKMILLEHRGSPNFGRLLNVLEMSVKSYNPEDARTLFRDAVLASLDEKTFSSKHAFPSFLTACLQVDDEVGWILKRKLDPEELYYLLGVLPQSGPFEGLVLQLAKRSIEQILQNSSNDCKIFTLETLVPFLKEHEVKIHNLPHNSVFHFLNILSFIFLRLSSYDYDLLKEMHSVFEGFKSRHDKKTQNISGLVINEAINRFLGRIQARTPLKRSLNYS